MPINGKWLFAGFILIISWIVFNQDLFDKVHMTLKSSGYTNVVLGDDKGDCPQESDLIFEYKFLNSFEADNEDGERVRGIICKQKNYETYMVIPK